MLGLAALAHDPAACMYIDGELVAAVEEERLSRVKNTQEFPFGAIRCVLDQAGLTIRDIDCIAYYWDDRGELWPALKGTLGQITQNPTGILRLLGSRVNASHIGPFLLRKYLAYMVDGDASALPPVYYVNHHASHLAGAWLSAPFEPDAGLIVDGRGEYAATSVFRATPAGPGLATCIETLPFPNSLGVFYGAITQILGYQAVADEYKVMGLASYGEPDPYWSDRVDRLLQLDEDGSYQLNLKYFYIHNCSGNNLPWLNRMGRNMLFGPFRDGEGGFNDAGRALAHAAQTRLQDALIGLIRRVVAHTGAKRLVLSGGVAMNGSAVGAVRLAGIVEQLHVPLAPYDAGASLGAALACLQGSGQSFEQGSQMQSPFTGPGYSEDEIAAMLQQYRWSFRRLDDAAKDAAREISAGRIVGWFDGRMELGARALGARSILGDPRDPGIRDRINSSVKRRESYRPFAPSILEEDASEYFDVVHSRFMGEVVQARSPTRKYAPAVVHVDGSARPQTVPRDWPAQSFRRLIEAFRDLTGVPMVVNTSFNVRGEPIVCSPDDAVRCFAASGLERLYLGPFRVDKQETDTQETLR